MTIGGGGDSQEPGGDTEIRLLEAALAVGEGESASTKDCLFGDTDGSMRMCSCKFPAAPPQCGGSVTEIFGINPDTGLRTPEGLDEVRLLGGGTG